MTVPARRQNRPIIAAFPTLLAVASCLAGANAAPRGGTLPGESPLAPTSTLARRCALVASCAHPHDPPNWRDPSACVDFWVARAGDPELPSCLSSASTCEAVAACLHPHRGGAPAAFCRAHRGEMTGCDGTALVSCGADDPEESTSVDCASLGARCEPLFQAGGLSTHACVDPVRCPSELTRAWCSGTMTLMSCHDGEIEIAACAPGSSCREHADKDGEHIAMCEIPGHATCPTPGKKRCDGSRLVECETHGHFAHEHSVDCASAGLTCALADRGATCTKPSPECHGGHATCDGGALVFCASGTLARVDCHDMGLGPCEPDGRGTSATCRTRAAEAR